MSLSVSRLVRVDVNLSPLAAAPRSFGVLMVAGDSNVISGLERFRTYVTIEGVATDFGVNAPEYHAAALYFGQTPKPSTIMIGRWLRTATAGFNEGGILSPSEQTLSNFTSITNGGLVISIDGTVHTLTGLDFSAETNLNGVASVITAALSGAGIVTWDGSEFKVISSTTGAATFASGSVSISAQPSPGDSFTVQGTAVSFVASGPSGNQVLISSVDAAGTMANLLSFLQSSIDANLSLNTYSANGSLSITVKALSSGTGGNAHTLVKSGTNLSVSGATLSGGTNGSSVSYATTGSGTDLSVPLKLTVLLSQALIPGYNAESPVECAAALAVKSAAWYGLMFQASTQPSDSQNLDVAEFIEALDLKRFFGVTITSTNVLSALVMNDLASLLKARGYLQSTTQYSQNAYAIASLFGREFSVDFNGNKTTITLMYKQEPGVVGEELTEQQAETLEAKRCNVFVNYVNNTVIIEDGTCAGPAYIDEIHGLNWLQDSIQNNCYNLLYQSTTKIPQTDAGVNQLVNAIAASCELAVTNGLVAPGTWTAQGFGELQTGQYLKSGYYIYAQPVALQSQADREARKAPPIQVAVKLAGAIQFVEIILNVNR